MVTLQSCKKFPGPAEESKELRPSKATVSDLDNDLPDYVIVDHKKLSIPMTTTLE